MTTLDRTSIQTVYQVRLPVVLVLREAVSSYNLKVRATGGALALLVKGGLVFASPPFVINTTNSRG